MNLVLSVLVGALFAGALYMVLRRNVVKLIIGFILLGHASNLLLFTAAGLVRGEPPLLAEARPFSARPVADPVPQALILTAIVIGFGVSAFSLVLVHRAHEEFGHGDLDRTEWVK